ncbi:hypothetical protein [Microscilla marina]|nr:hypothetical protein [Microscilla marina]
MMKKISSLMLILLFSTSVTMAQRRAKTPLKLLKIVYKLAEAKKYDKLKKFLYNGKVSEKRTGMTGKTMRELLLNGIKNKSKSGDFSYNGQGLKLIIDKYSDRIIPIPQKLRKRLFEGNRDFAQFPDLKTISEQRPQDIYIFDYKSVHILMAKIDKGYQLVFWEGLKRINSKNSSTSESKKSSSKTTDGGGE